MIITAVQKGSTVYVYGEHNRLMFIKSGELHGYTGSSVSVKKGNTVYTITSVVRLFLCTT